MFSDEPVYRVNRFRPGELKSPRESDRWYICRQGKLFVALVYIIHGVYDERSIVICTLSRYFIFSLVSTCDNLCIACLWLRSCSENSPSSLFFFIYLYKLTFIRRGSPYGIKIIPVLKALTKSLTPFITHSPMVARK